MPTNAENIRKNDDAFKKTLAIHDKNLKKAQAAYKAKKKKYIEIEVRRLVKILDETSYFNKDFTDEKLLLKMLEAFGSKPSEKSEAAGEG